MKNEEHIEQVNFVNWFEHNYPDVRLFAIPNGGKRNIKTAINLKSEGVKPGVPDLFIPAYKLFIEMKKKNGGKATKEQLQWIDYLLSVGYKAVVCNGCEEAKNAVIEHNEKLQATL